MQLLLEQSGDVRIVGVKEAKLTYPVLSSFLAEVREIVEDGARKMVIDLEGVTYIDSASIGCLMEIHRLLKDREGALKLSGLQPRVETMLSMTGVHTIVDVYREEAEALAAFGRPSKRKGGRSEPRRRRGPRRAVGAGGQGRERAGGLVSERSRT